MTASLIAELLYHEGPLTGSELLDRTGQEALFLWRACRTSNEIAYELAGRRYLRLDRTVEGWARLSPSIRREFLTFTVFGGVGQKAAVTERATRLSEDSRRVSIAKSRLVAEAMASCLAELNLEESLMGKVTVFIAGDVTYGMAHSVPRPESSTGEMVRGSDLDVIVVVTDDFPAVVLQELDRVIYRRKHFLLMHPAHREEIDYVIKRLNIVREQLRFDTFEHCVASKILHEGKLLCGSRMMFDVVKELVKESGVPTLIAGLERRAAADRAAAEEYLLRFREGEYRGRYSNLFYSHSEGDEIY